MSVNFIKRSFKKTVHYHHLDHYGLVSNISSFRWFEIGVLRVMLSIYPGINGNVFKKNRDKKQIVFVSIEKNAQFIRPGRQDDLLIVETHHKKEKEFPGYLTFDHIITDVKTKKVNVTGTSKMGIIEIENGIPSTFLRTLPEDIWVRYLNAR